MRFLVTGGSGFVGSHLIEFLLKKKHTVRVLLRSDRISPRLQDLPVETAVAPYSDPQALKKAVKGVDCILHVGGVTKGVTADDYFAGNAVTTRALLDAAVSVKPRPARFLLVSSIAMIGPVADPDRPAGEDDPPRPVETYGASKLAAELITRSYSHLIPVTVVRPPTVFGPRDVDCFEMFKLANKRLNLFYGNARKQTSIVYIEDLVDGIYRAATAKKGINRSYFLCNQEAVTWKELQNGIKRAVGKRCLTIYLPGFIPRIAAFFGDIYAKLSGKAVLINSQKVKMGKPRYWITSNERARRELKFKEQRTLQENLQSTCDWYRSEGWL